MGFVEKYGLVALFVLCALIVGVGIFADDGALSTARETNRTKEHVSQRGASIQPGGDRESQQSGDYDAARRKAEARRKDLLDGGPLGVLRDDPSVSSDPGKDIAGAFGAPKHMDGNPRPGRLADDIERHNEELDDTRKQESTPGGSQPHRARIELGGEPREPREVPPAPKSGGDVVVKDTVRYEIREGDSLWRIAAHFYGTKKIDTVMASIRAANPDVNFEPLKHGRPLLLPTSGMREEGRPAAAAPAKDPGAERKHVVKKGESLWAIAEQYYEHGKFFGALAKHNRIDPNKALSPGTELRIPALGR